MDNLGYLPSLFLRSGFACLIGGFGQLLGDDRNRKDLIGEPSRSTLQTRKTTRSDAVFACSSISPHHVTLDWSQAEGRPVSLRLPSEAAAVRRPKQSPSVSHGLDPSHKTPSPPPAPEARVPIQHLHSLVLSWEFPQRAVWGGLCSDVCFPLPVLALS